MCDSLVIVAADNKPIFQGNREGTNDLDLAFCAHSSLDILFEKIGDSRDLYLGLLYENETHRVYGYCSASKIKFLALFNVSQPVRENEIKLTLRTLHLNYIEAISNPFYEHGSRITSEKFITRAQQMLTSSN